MRQVKHLKRISDTNTIDACTVSGLSTVHQIRNEHNYRSFIVTLRIQAGVRSDIMTQNGRASIASLAGGY